MNIYWILFTFAFLCVLAIGFPGNKFLEILKLCVGLYLSHVIISDLYPESGDKIKNTVKRGVRNIQSRVASQNPTNNMQVRSQNPAIRRTRMTERQDNDVYQPTTTDA